MKIKNILAVPCLSGYYFDDLTAIRAGAIQDGFLYVGKPQTPGFKSIRQKGESVSVILILDDDEIAYGDCVISQYAGAGGREQCFNVENIEKLINKYIKPFFINKELSSFRDLAEQFDKLKFDESLVNPSIKFGVSQALLDAVSKTKRITMAEVIANEYKLKLSSTIIPIKAQTGDDRYLNADKMILKKALVMPHGLFNNIEKVGEKGEVLLKYVYWLRDRIKQFGEPGYFPTIHLDVYGILGIIFQNNLILISDYLKQLSNIAYPFPLSVEMPIEMETKDKQIEIMKKLIQIIKKKKINVKIVLDEWCNSIGELKELINIKAVDVINIKAPDFGGLKDVIESLIYCKNNNVGASLSGSSNCTDKAARVLAHIALATQPICVSANPGMGVDEGIQIVFNEMKRTLAIYSQRNNLKV